jgi:phospholipase C
MGDLLNTRGIGWRYYSAMPPARGYLWSSYDAIRHIRQTAQWPRHVRSVKTLMDDIRGTRLPPVTWITPTSPLSEHPEFNLCYGENWTTRVVDAVMRSSIWRNTAIFITWDDWGGYYDHVPPPPDSDRFGLGFRVPLLVISPYALEGAVDHQLGDFSSVLRFVEDNWGLDHLNMHDRTAGDLSHDFDFSAAPRPAEPLPQRTDCHGPLRPAGAQMFDPD